MRNEQQNQSLYETLQTGFVAIPYHLLKNYAKLGISDEEMMLYLQLLSFQQNEHNPFPSYDELAEHMSCDRLEVANRILKLVEKGALEVVERRDPSTGQLTEVYRLDPLLARWQDLRAQQSSQTTEVPETQFKQQQPLQIKNLFTLFEETFGRPLSPLEYETINAWIDQDGCSEDLIKAALKEAVIHDKLSIRYIDRILFTWQRQQIHTPDEARNFAAQFHPPLRETKEGTSSFTFYNWLEEM